MRTLRHNRQLSQSQLAKKIGVSASMIGLYENSERMPSLETLLEISRVFNVSTDFLLGRDQDSSMTIEVTGITLEQKLAVDNIIEQLKKI